MINDIFYRHFHHHSVTGVLSWDCYILTQYFHKPDISSDKAGLVRKPPTLRHQLMCLKTFYSKFVSTFHKFFSPFTLEMYTM